MKIVFLGSGEFGIPTLEWLASSGYGPAAVITQPARPAGRGRKATPTPIARRAEELDLPCHKSPNINDPTEVARIRDILPDVLIVIAFGQKIGSELLHLPNCRVLNLHASLLPKYRGAAPINWAIIRGETQTGITIFQIDEGWDTGAILGQAATAIAPTETAGELHDRLARMGPDLWAKVLGDTEQNIIRPIAQDSGQACPAPKLRKTDGAIRWDRPAAEIRNLIHGMWPWPGAYCTVEFGRESRHERVGIARAALANDEAACSPSGMNPGTLDEKLNIVCGSGRLKPLELKPENGTLMPFADFANGRHLQPGDRFIDGDTTLI